MNPVPESEDWLEAIQARRLSPEAVERLRRELARRPRERSRLEEELALNQALDSLPPVPVASNFLAQVEARIAREDRAASRSGTLWDWFTGLRLVRPLAAVAVVALALGGWWQFRAQQRSSLATSIAAVSQTAGVPGVESLRDFDAVQLLRTSALPGDVELLAALDMDTTSATP